MRAPEVEMFAIVPSPLRSGPQYATGAGISWRVLAIRSAFMLPYLSGRAPTLDEAEVRERLGTEAFRLWSGFMVGLESEQRGIERAGTRLVCATCVSQLPVDHPVSFLASAGESVG